MGGAAPAEMSDWPAEKVLLFRYILVVATLAFCNRNLPTSFLPLVLSSEFRETALTVGLTFSAYPAAALLASGWATRAAIAARNVIYVHSFSLLSMSAATAIFGLAQVSVLLLGHTAAQVAAIVLRLLQGVTAAMYLSSNMTLITRYFPDSMPYVLGMVEVGVGVGAQIGRLLGGVLYDVGGFACPFLTLAFVQAGWGVLGFQFKEIPGSGAANSVTERKLARPRYFSFLTKRNVIALVAVLFNYFLIGFMDATLPGHLEEHLGPLPVSVISMLLSVRSFTYLCASYLCAQAMHRKLLSHEHMLAVGAFCCVIGMLMIGPVRPMRDALAELALNEWQLTVGTWAAQVLSLVAASSGLAATFIPVLPLMQSEVRHLGSQAVEQVAQLFIAAMSLGEALGPTLGGALSERIGFAPCGVVCVAPMVVVLAGSLLLHDPAVVAERAGPASLDAEALAPLMETDEQPFWAMDVLDGENAFRVRSMSVSMRQNVGPPGSAPSLVFRRSFSPKQQRKKKPWESAPSSTFRRAYQKEGGEGLPTKP